MRVRVQKFLFVRTCFLSRIWLGKNDASFRHVSLTWVLASVFCALEADFVCGQVGVIPSLETCRFLHIIVYMFVYMI